MGLLGPSREKRGPDPHRGVGVDRVVRIRHVAALDADRTERVDDVDPTDRELVKVDQARLRRALDHDGPVDDHTGSQRDHRDSTVAHHEALVVAGRDEQDVSVRAGVDGRLDLDEVSLPVRVDDPDVGEGAGQREGERDEQDAAEETERAEGGHQRSAVVH